MRHMDNMLFTIPPVMVIMHVATTPRPANANPFRCHTYESSLRKPCRINTYKKQGVGEGVPRISILWFRSAACGHRSEAKLESIRQPWNLLAETFCPERT